MSAVPKVAFFLPSMSGGGAERVTANLIRGLVHADTSVELVLGQKQGQYLELVPGSVPIIELGCDKVTRCIPKLIRYLRGTPPAVLFSQMSHANLAAITATRFARGKTQLVIGEHLSPSAYQGPVARDRLIVPLARWNYGRAAQVVCVSQGAADDWAAKLGWSADRIEVIYNPVVTPELVEQAAVRPAHPWLGIAGTPCLLAAGRIVPQKDFSTLVDAFALLRERLPAKLLILGEGEGRGELEKRIAAKGLKDEVDLVGQIENPYGWMAACDCFVLSSRWEALPTVLIEAMACGTRVVATDCPSGPHEILAGGSLAPLVPPERPADLSEAIQQVLQDPVSEALQQRAGDFSLEAAVQAYQSLIGRLLPPAR